MLNSRLNLASWLPLLLLVSAHGAHARQCFEDEFGNIQCTGLSTGARVGIAIAVFVVGAILFGLLAYWRRRRVRNQNLVYVVSPGSTYPSQYNAGGQPYNAYNPPAGYPQYPPHAYGEQYSSYAPSTLGANKGYNANPSYPGTPTGGAKA